MERRHSQTIAPSVVGASAAMCLGMWGSYTFGADVLRALFLGTGAATVTLVIAMGWHTRGAFEKLIELAGALDVQDESVYSRSLLKEVEFTSGVIVVTAIAGGALVTIAEYLRVVQVQLLGEAFATVVGSALVGLTFGLLWWMFVMLSSAAEMRRDLRMKLRAIEERTAEANSRLRESKRMEIARGA